MGSPKYSRIAAIFLILGSAVHAAVYQQVPMMDGNSIDGEITDPAESNEIFFTLLTHDMQNIPICTDNSSEYLKSLFNPKVKTIFIVHGWLSSQASDTVNYTAAAYASTNEPSNIVKVDWSYDASWKFYPLAALYVSYVGGVIANMINRLMSLDAVHATSLHLIGHSLGAHAMGKAGSSLADGKKPARITGLDPAKPGFEGIVNESYRLDTTDADFVDVIHSAAGAAGYSGPLGHVDFYPNGGSPPEPGCFELTAPWLLIGCSHARAYYYYIESITNPKGFPAIECGSYSDFKSGTCDNNQKTYMGDPTPSSARGIFYLETNSESPYAKGEAGLHHTKK